MLKHDNNVNPKTSSAAAVAASKQRRILVLTDAPRLLFLDPVGNIVRGNLELSGGEDSGTAPPEAKMVSVQCVVLSVLGDY